jgi:hypothetical protein
VSENVISDNQVGFSSLRRECPGSFIAKELAMCLNAISSSDLSYVGCGLKSEARNSRLDKIFQQVAIVAGDLNDKTVFTQILLSNVTQ